MSRSAALVLASACGAHAAWTDFFGVGNDSGEVNSGEVNSVAFRRELGDEAIYDGLDNANEERELAKKKKYAPKRKVKKSPLNNYVPKVNVQATRLSDIKHGLIKQLHVPEAEAVKMCSRLKPACLSEKRTKDPVISPIMAKNLLLRQNKNLDISRLLKICGKNTRKFEVDIRDLIDSKLSRSRKVRKLEEDALEEDALQDENERELNAYTWSYYSSYLVHQYMESLGYCFSWEYGMFLTGSNGEDGRCERNEGARAWRGSLSNHKRNND